MREGQITSGALADAGASDTVRQWVGPEDLFTIARVPLETPCHWLFYLIVVSGFQSAGRLNSLKIAPGRGPLPGYAIRKGK